MCELARQPATKTWPEIMSIATAADYLDTNPRHIRHLIGGNNPRLKSHKLGGKVRIKKSVIDAYLDSTTVGA